MKASDFYNTKWDAREWTKAQKRKWQERMFEFGIKWAGGFSEILNLNGDFYYIRDSYITWGAADFKESFFSDPMREMQFSDAFPGEQGQKHDHEKPRYDLLPPIAIDEMAKVMTFGAKKYAPDNWRHVDDALSRYRAALLRHTFAMMRGERLDPETGLSHAAHAMCCAAFLAELDK